MKLCDLDELKQHKALLAFSHGSDSTALFHLLVDQGVDFDCALVNYKIRPSSDEEEQNAKALCQKYNKHFFSSAAPIFSSNFESNARAFRLEFFKKICSKHGYNALIFAHQLNDAFEWMLMRLKRGAGLANLLGFDEYLGHIRIFRPLLYTSKDEILEYLKTNKIKYFDDLSNYDEKFERNYIRRHFSSEFVKFAKLGLARSFKALKADKILLCENFLYSNNNIFILKNSSLVINAADKACKMLGVVLSAKQRELINTALNERKDIVISHKIAFGVSESFVFIAPFCSCVLPKDFKEKCRKLKIPSKIRPYLFANYENFNSICELIQKIQ